MNKEQLFEAIKFAEKKKITPSRLLIMLHLLSCENNEDNMTSISDSVNLLTASVTGQADTLENMGLARRSRDYEDRRIVKLKLTTQGAELAYAIIALTEKTITAE